MVFVSDIGVLAKVGVDVLGVVVGVAGPGGIERVDLLNKKS